MSNAAIRTATLDCALFQAMLEGGYRNLKRNMQVVDELNVFPVPDGDTGKNMTMTIEGGVLGINGTFGALSEMMAKFSRSSLLSARGNSGVILSQFIRGLAEGSQSVTDCYTPESFAAAFESGKNCAYRAVANPVEGTMLTLLREGSDFLNSNSFSDFEECFEALLGELRRSLQHTPELLPVLREAGVVDSGGAGLLCIFEGMQLILAGEEIDETEPPLSGTSFTDPGSFNENSTLEYGYCTEFILQLLHAKTSISAFRLEEMTNRLQKMGDSVVTVQDGSLIKVHVHTFAPEQVLGYARKFGEFVSLKIENMSVQHSETERRKPAEHQKYAVVATATGEGLTQFFKDVGVSAVINGGRTNNPSAEDFIAAFTELNADYIIVLPNDSNVILTAEQAAALYEQAEVRVIPTHSIAEGYSALSMMDLSADTVDELIEEMACGLPNVTTGYVTTAIRDSRISGIDIHKDDWMGLVKDTVYASTDSPIKAALELFANLPDIEEKQVITAFYGCEVSDEELAEFEAEFSARHPLIELGFIFGGQEVYRYIFAIE